MHWLKSTEEEDVPSIGYTPVEDIDLSAELRVGNPTAMNGDFFTEMFGNDTADIDVRALIHGYNLINWDQSQGIYVVDTSVVDDLMVVEDEEGNDSYYFVLKDDLYWNDGTPITAWDYAFSLLLQMSPEIEEIGGRIYRAEHILGAKEYIAKETKYLGGVDVLSDNQLMICLDHEFLPYFFELGLLMVNPYPISEIAPGCKVYDDGFGVYIGNANAASSGTNFTADLLRETILNPETGYNSHPTLTCGPYSLKSFDGEVARFEKNPYFKGTMDGIVPTIERISYTVADNETLVDQLRDGTFNLVNKVSYGPTIQQGMEASADGIQFSNYPRIGLMALTFSFDKPTVNDEKVRQAIAWCMNREQITQDYCQGFGLTVDGYYGIEQWEYLLVNGQLDYPIPSNGENPLSGAEIDAATAAWEELNLDSLTHYTVDTDKANELLDEAGWTLNKDGEDYRPGTDDVRCKMVDGELVSLELSMMYPKGNRIVDSMQANFIDNLNACGITLTMVPEEMQSLLSQYYRAEERTVDMILIATNFHVVVDPAIEYSTDTSAGHVQWNNTYSDDEELYQLAVDMRKTEPGSTFEYVQKWIKFQEKYNEVLPMIPIYSNIYYDFYANTLQNYYITSHVTWSHAILESYFGESAAVPTEETEVVVEETETQE